MHVVPVTTRTFEQYERLSASLETLGWKDTLICNGSILLHNHVEDPAWTLESVRLSERDQDAFASLYKRVKSELDTETMVSVLPFLFYIKTSEAEKVCAQLRQWADLSHLSILNDKRKVYCIPASLNKGSAVLRYRKRYELEHCMAAGDSIFDLPMLQAADISFCPAFLENAAAIKSCERLPTDGFFSDRLCERLESLKSEEQTFDQKYRNEI